VPAARPDRAKDAAVDGITISNVVSAVAVTPGTDAAIRYVFGS
jgi:hypothetical protein